MRSLGKGGFGEVFLVKHFLTGEEFAIKKILFKNIIPANKIEEIYREEKNLQTLNHPNIIKLVNVFKIHAQLILILEYLPGGDLKHFLAKRRETTNECKSGLSEAEVRAIL